ncbi:MAG: HpcH/HpaI aldolase/citrate lyase family protein [Prevotella sp.]|nr:HpcH/HpaI aldolase/citrate lyase family protein [Prevotella sp.]
MLNLMYITKRPEIARIAEEAGVDWIFVDMEFIGKDARQGGLDTVQNHHTVEDVKNVKAAVTKAKVLVRVNPIHEAMADYPSSEDEINATIEAGADIVMLPFFKTIAEVEQFIRIVGGRAKTCLLVETPEAALLLDDILNVDGIDMIHLGLNDLHLALGMKFMFELLSDGTVDRLASKIKAKGIPFGFGGVATLTGGAMPGSMVIKEHYRLGSSMVIVSRSFCNTDKITDLEEVHRIFQTGIADIRRLEEEAEKAATYFSNNRRAVIDSVKDIIRNK